MTQSDALMSISVSESITWRVVTYSKWRYTLAGCLLFMLILTLIMCGLVGNRGFVVLLGMVVVGRRFVLCLHQPKTIGFFLNGKNFSHINECKWGNVKPQSDYRGVEWYLLSHLEIGMCSSIFGHIITNFRLYCFGSIVAIFSSIVLFFDCGGYTGFNGPSFLVPMVNFHLHIC